MRFSASYDTFRMEDYVVTKRIGLLPTFEVGMPVGLQRFFEFLDLKIKHKGETYQFECERLKVHPVDIRENVKERWDLFVDRTTHWHKFMRAYVQHAIYDGVYVLNHPTTFNAINKHASFVMLERLGAKIPETIMIPQHTYVETEDYYMKKLQISPNMTQEKYDEAVKMYYHYRDVWLPEMFKYHNEMFDFDAIPEKVGGYPFYLKPGQDGGGGSGVSRIKNDYEFHEKYAESEDRIMHAQEAIEFDEFCRCMGIGPQIHPMKFLPEEPIHRHYHEDPIQLDDKIRKEIIDQVKIVNAFFRWEYNSYEALIKDGELYPIDFANACPDSAITSLHVHFPWLLKALVRWIVFCAVTDRQMSFDLNQREYLEKTAGKEPAEKLKIATQIAEDYFQEKQFRDFANKHLSHLDEAFAEFFDKGYLEEVIVDEIRVSRFPQWEHEKFIHEYREKVAHAVQNRLYEEW